MKSPLLIQIDLLGTREQPVRARWLSRLAELPRAERPLVLLGARPDGWTPTRNRVDRAFGRQATIEAELRRAGGLLDAVVYLDFGLFGRKRQLERSLADLANRYNAALDDMTLIAAPGKIAEGLNGLVGRVATVENDDEFERELERALGN